MGQIEMARRPGEGGTRELLALAWPFILSNSLWTIQIALDRILLSRAGGSAVGAAMVTAAVFWMPITLVQYTAGYATTFVAQYTGAGQAHRVGPAVWQALHFSLVAGLLFLLVFLPMNLLSGSNTPLESMPPWLATIMQASPTGHFVSFAQAILYRGAGFRVVWPQFALTGAIGVLILLLVLFRFRKVAA